jgi:NADH-quinone oxidoreductase subunit G
MIVTINGRDIELGDKERLNVVQAAQRAGVEIPHYCWHPALSVVASCRMCLVEVGEKKPDGTSSIPPKVFPACQTPVKNGMVVVTESPRVKAAQAGTLEYILLNHPLDCPTCDQAGECFLQDYTFRYGRGAETRMQEPKTLKVDKDHIGEHITLFTDRCIMCSRCVRFTREISGTAELQVINRGSHAEIDIFPGQPCDNKLAGNVVDLCPVGALCSKDFLYKQRVWWLKTSKSVCGGCSTGCSIHVDQNDNSLYRLRPRTNPQAQGYFMCDEGRFGFRYVHSAKRLTQPAVRTVAGQRESAPTPVDWSVAIEKAKSLLTARAKAAPGKIAAVISPFATVEEAYLLAEFLGSLDADAKLYLGPVPVVGTDDEFPKGPDGKPNPPIKFTIRAEKCPNRLGVSKVLEHFDPNFGDWNAFLADASAGKIEGVYLLGGYADSWLDAAALAALRKPGVVVLQDILDSDACRIADVVIPGASWVEKDGTWVNHAGLAQQLKWAIRPGNGPRPDGRTLLELRGHRGLFHAPTIRKEIAEHITWFRGLKAGDLGDHGVKLGVETTEPAALAAS